MKRAATFLLLLISLFVHGQNAYLLKPDRVFDGTVMHDNWWVLVKDSVIVAAGDSNAVKAACGKLVQSVQNDGNLSRLASGNIIQPAQNGAHSSIAQSTTSNQILSPIKVLDLQGMTLMPGLIEGHSHLFLHPYNETSWNDQVLTESPAERTARAVVHANATLLAGFTTARDLGTEGAMYDDAGLKEAINKGIIPGPRLLVATRAIVATGSYGPKGFNGDIPLGAEEADGTDGLTKAIRSQIGHGADIIKLYADYRWGLNKTPAPTFTTNELKLAVEVAGSSGRYVVVHSGTEEGMRRAIAAGVRTIEHGDGGTPELFKQMKEKGIALCPTLTATESIASYKGWRKGLDPETPAIKQKHKIFTDALNAGVTICMGGDVGVFAHGDNCREMILMVEYGMKPIDVLHAATAVNASVFGLSTLGNIKPAFLADLVAVQGNPAADISLLKLVSMVMKNGVVVSHFTR